MKTFYELEILDDGHLYSLREVCERSRLQEDFVTRCVEYGIIDVAGDDLSGWGFPARSLRRLLKASRLQRDLELNFSGLGLALELLDEVESLQGQITSLKKQLRGWEG